MRISRAAPTRFTPFSYFCTCWNEMPIPLAEAGLRHAAREAMEADVAADHGVAGLRPARDQRHLPRAKAARQYASVAVVRVAATASGSFES